jgi:hypothetical protein
MRYKFDVEILNQNPFQVQLDTYQYSYREYDEFVSVPDSLGEKLGFELRDYYRGNFFTFSGLYPDLRGPGGGGYSASSFVGNYNDFRTVDTIGGGKDFSMYFDKNILDSIPGSIEKISSDIKFIIESAFKNSTPNKNEVYIDTIFTRDNKKRAESNQIRIKKVNGVDKEEQNPNYTPNGKTYSIPSTPDFELRASRDISTDPSSIGVYYISYIIKEIVPTPKKEETIQDQKQDENAPVKVSEESKISSYVFNVEKVKTFSNSNFGDLVIVESKLAEESSSEIVEDFVFSGEDDDELLDDEFREDIFVGDEEMEQEGNPEEKSGLGTEIEYEDNITNKVKLNDGKSGSEWNKTGTIIEGSKVPLGLSSPPKYNLNVSINKTIRDEYIPIIKQIKGYTIGAKLLAILMAQKEGFKKGTRSYNTNNPGNIGNTDSGANRKLKNLKDGILLQLDYITKVANGQHKAYPIGKEKKMSPYYSPEIAKNNGPGQSYYGMTEYLPGYKFIYTGKIEQYVKIYATGSRQSNSYISMIVYWFKQNGYDSINEETTIKEIITLNNNPTSGIV